MNSSQLKSFLALKKSHTELHQVINSMEYSNKITPTTKANIARIISQLANSLAYL